MQEKYPTETYYRSVPLIRYYKVTRGEWWNWWNYRKTQYWFSPSPCPVEWYAICYKLRVFFRVGHVS